MRAPEATEICINIAAIGWFASSSRPAVAWLERYAAFYEAFRQAEAEWLRDNPPLRPQECQSRSNPPPEAD